MAKTRAPRLKEAVMDIHIYIRCPHCDGQIDCVNWATFDNLAEVMECEDCGEQVKRPANPFNKLQDSLRAQKG